MNLAFKALFNLMDNSIKRMDQAKENYYSQKSKQDLEYEENNGWKIAIPLKGNHIGEFGVFFYVDGKPQKGNRLYCSHLGDAMYLCDCKNSEL